MQGSQTPYPHKDLLNPFNGLKLILKLFLLLVTDGMIVGMGTFTPSSSFSLSLHKLLKSTSRFCVYFYRYGAGREICVSPCIPRLFIFKTKIVSSGS